MDPVIEAAVATITEDAWEAFEYTDAIYDLDTVTADKTHRGRAVIDQVNADLKNSALAHLQSGVFTANAA